MVGLSNETKFTWINHFYFRSTKRWVLSKRCSGAFERRVRCLRGRATRSTFCWSSWSFQEESCQPPTEPSLAGSASAWRRGRSCSEAPPVRSATSARRRTRRTRLKVLVESKLNVLPVAKGSSIFVPFKHLWHFATIAFEVVSCLLERCQENLERLLSLKLIVDAKDAFDRN